MIEWMEKKVIINVKHVVLNSIFLKSLLIIKIIQVIEDLDVAGNSCTDYPLRMNCASYIPLLVQESTGINISI